MRTWKEVLRGLYHGSDRSSRNFRFVLIVVDVIAIAYFIVTAISPETPHIFAVDVAIAAFIACDLIARWWITYHPVKFMREFTTIADIIVIGSLVVPWIFGNFLFLRVLRAMRLLRSYRVLADLRQEFSFFKRNEELIQSAVNLVVFVFIMSGIVFVLQVNINSKINNYLDALYFTVAALTTTGFGDITLEGTSGRLLSVAILLLGVALFLRLIQTIFRPTRIAHACPDCGLHRHDADAVHCKHCGKVLNISNPGES